MDLNQNIPLEVLQQFIVESQPQYVGFAPEGISLSPESGNVYNTSTNSSVQQGPITNVANRCTMVTSNFVTSYTGSTNNNRAYLLIQNNGAGVMYVVVGGVASSGFGIQIAVGGYWEPLVVPINTFSILGTGTLVEGTIQ